MRVGSRRLVAAADAAAQAAGISPGVAVAHARALVSDLVVADADPAADIAGLTKLAAWAAKRYSPLAAPNPPDGLWLDATGCAHLFGGEKRLLRSLVRRCAAMGVAARAAIADTAGAAHAVARFMPGGQALVVPSGATATTIAPLPVAALRLPADAVDGLRRLGFERISQLMDIARAPLARRFGLELFRRLDQALGMAPEPIEPIFPAEIPRSRIGLAEPIATAGAINRVIERLSRDLCVELEARGQGARQLDLLCYRIDGGVQSLRAGTAKPSRDPKHLARLLGQLVETIDPGFGIELMMLMAPHTEPLAARQFGSGIEGEAPEPDLAELIDRLIGRLGNDKLYRVVPVDSDVPERSVRRVPPLSSPAGRLWPTRWKRPARLLHPPEPVDTIAMMPDHPPAQFTWRGIRHRVHAVDGPERIHGEWWKAEAEASAVRDYFQVENESGMRFWLFRANNGEDAATGPMRWYLHGLFA